MFASLRDQFGEFLDLESGADSAALMEALQSKGAPVEHCRLAVNRAFVSATTPISPSDELALIPPVSGG